MKKVLLILLIACAFLKTQAQTEEDSSSVSDTVQSIADKWTFQGDVIAEFRIWKTDSFRVVYNSNYDIQYLKGDTSTALKYFIQGVEAYSKVLVEMVISLKSTKERCDSLERELNLKKE